MEAEMKSNDQLGMTVVEPETSEYIIETCALTKRYGSFTAVNDLNLRVRRGEVFGLLGPNGAGKTTTTLMLLGLTEPSAGTAHIGGVNCTREPMKVKRRVGYLPDNVGFYPDMTGRENLRLTAKMNGMAEDKIEAHIEALLERVGMAYAADKRTGTYSKGMKQRLGIADILVKDPDVLIMDEPTNGIDPQGMRELMELIRELSIKDGKTILISSHQLHQIQQICDRVGIFVNGEIVACGSVEELGEQIEQEMGFRILLQTIPGGKPLCDMLERLQGVTKAEPLADDTVLVHAREDVCDEVVSCLLVAGFKLKHLQRYGGDLDEIYSRYFEKAGEYDAAGASKRRGASVSS